MLIQAKEPPIADCGASIRYKSCSPASIIAALCSKSTNIPIAATQWVPIQSGAWESHSSFTQWSPSGQNWWATINNLPILDVRALSEQQLAQLAGSYEKLASMDLKTIPNMADDPVRKAIDEAFSKVLGLPSLDNLRAELAAEPVICNRPLGFEITAPAIEDQLQFELI
ncbi:hypothetical protein [Mesorhizobium sp. M0643]|uniref:hypothetical protein n=1 Tax=unclassified Mesorhizobium TaxID=325217 RepID=UPI0033357139